MSYQEQNDLTPARKKSNVTATISIIVIAGILLLMAFAFSSLESSGRPQPGETAPDFTLTLLDSTEVSLDSLRGKIIVLNFWASWCTSCRQEAPDIQKVWETYQDKNVVFLGVGFQDTETDSRAFIEEFSITYPNGLDKTGKLGRAYGVTAVPETFVIDTGGQVAQVYIGPVTENRLAQQLAQMTNH